MKAKTNSVDLNGYKNRKAVIDGLVLQINKDLKLEIQIDPETAVADLYDTLVKKTTPFVRALIQQGGGQLEQLLYKIDVSEEKVKDNLQSTSETDPALIFTTLILERELQKVVFRMLFSKGIIE